MPVIFFILPKSYPTWIWFEFLLGLAIILECVVEIWKIPKNGWNYLVTQVYARLILRCDVKEIFCKLAKSKGSSKSDNCSNKLSKSLSFQNLLWHSMYKTTISFRFHERVHSQYSLNGGRAKYSLKHYFPLPHPKIN